MGVIANSSYSGTTSNATLMPFSPLSNTRASMHLASRMDHPNISFHSSSSSPSSLSHAASTELDTAKVHGMDEPLRTMSQDLFVEYADLLQKELVKMCLQTLPISSRGLASNMRTVGRFCLDSLRARVYALHSVSHEEQKVLLAVLESRIHAYFAQIRNLVDAENARQHASVFRSRCENEMLEFGRGLVAKWFSKSSSARSWILASITGDHSASFEHVHESSLLFPAAFTNDLLTSASLEWRSLLSAEMSRRLGLLFAHYSRDAVLHSVMKTSIDEAVEAMRQSAIETAFEYRDYVIRRCDHVLHAFKSRLAADAKLHISSFLDACGPAIFSLGEKKLKRSQFFEDDVSCEEDEIRGLLEPFLVSERATYPECFSTMVKRIPMVCEESLCLSEQERVMLDECLLRTDFFKPHHEVFVRQLRMSARTHIASQTARLTSSIVSSAVHCVMSPCIQSVHISASNTHPAACVAELKQPCGKSMPPAEVPLHTHDAVASHLELASLQVPHGGSMLTSTFLYADDVTSDDNTSEASHSDDMHSTASESSDDVVGLCSTCSCVHKELQSLQDVMSNRWSSLMSLSERMSVAQSSMLDYDMSPFTVFACLVSAGRLSISDMTPLLDSVVIACIETALTVARSGSPPKNTVRKFREYALPELTRVVLDKVQQHVGHLHLQLDLPQAQPRDLRSINIPESGSVSPIGSS
eukprot:ANDGO_00287.mRNA.1 hypothetical protein